MDDRMEQARQRIHDAYSHKDTGELPVLVMDVNYWVSGDAPQMIPDDYFTSSASMLEFQQAKIDRHLASIQDDYIPLLYPWYGTGVVPSAIGSKVLFQRGMDPAVEGPVLERPEDIRKLRRPNPLTDGLMPRVLETIRYFREHSDLPVMFTDAQGPLNIALTLCGVENFFVWAKEQPLLAHELMDYTTEVLIDWIRVQKQYAGQSEKNGAFPHSILLPEGFGGVCISDDDCTVISPKMYREFVVPYNSRVFQAFGGGTLHFCGSAMHQIENFLATDGLTGINCFCMGDFKQIRRMQEKFDNRLTLMVCDFTPLNIDSYYRELLANLGNKGTILATYPAAEFALEGGKYQIVSRDSAQLAEETARIIGANLARPRQLVKLGALALRGARTGTSAL
jgi:uroporphyrinogen-III decarboxylase